MLLSDCTHKLTLGASGGVEKFRFLSVGVLCTVEQKTELEKQIKGIFLKKDFDSSKIEYRKILPYRQVVKGTKKQGKIPCFSFYASI